MPRRRPVQRRRGPRPYRDVDGVPGAANAAVRRWEQEQDRPGAVAEALRAWSAIVHAPLVEVDGDGLCDEPFREDPCPCRRCADRFVARRVLEVALRGLPARAARAVRAEVAALDAVLLARTHQVAERADAGRRAADPSWGWLPR